MAANILVVEDDRLNRQLISKVLRREGYQVVEACDGEHALEILQMLPFDLVITDFMMPKLNGLKLVKQASRFSATPSYNLYHRLSLRHFRRENNTRSGRGSSEAV
jgi:CheY-like chemotaxis protein